jgi:hypothetical protein
MAIRIFLISKLLKLNYLNYIIRSKTQVRPLQSRWLCLPGATPNIASAECVRSRARLQELI